MVRLQRVTAHVGEGEVMMVSHWTDGTRSTQWVERSWAGLWEFAKLSWQAMRAGVKVEVE